ncbi:MAG: mitochondrial fission ELM1 family protein [Candidatus Omnitrophica bacterium]|nr:mitochondrial fission ELM1 family protein [Candidatus Omnitrophota bacterium]
MAKLNSFQASLACTALKGISAFFKALPLPAGLWIGRRIGELSFWLNPKSRRKAYQNVRIAFGASKNWREIDRIVWDLHRAFGQNVVEVARLTLIPARGYEQYVIIDGREHIDAAIKKGRGVIFLSIHSGNWELSNMVGSLVGYPYNMVANYLGHVNQVADLLDSWRTSGGCRIINPGIGGREIIRALKRNEIVTLVADQGGSDGMNVPFFNRDASMSTGAVRIALKYGVPVFLVDMHRVNIEKHHLEVEPVDLVVTADPESDVYENMVRIARRFEEWTIQHPAEYLWFYKTWKYATDRHVVILDDGRTGHLRQSQAMARQVAAVLLEQGLKATVSTIRIEWRNSLSGLLCGLLSMMRPLTAGLGLLALKPFLTDESYAFLCSIKTDTVISCGTRNAWVNVWLSADNEARSICVLRPGGPGPAGPSPNDFSLVVLPRHDVKGQPPVNAVLTKVAPNLIDHSYLDNNVRGLVARFSHLKLHGRPKIGFLIGGDTKGVVLSEQQIRVVIHQLKEAAGKFSADILVTTSRRTSPEVEALVAREFNDYSRSALVILASKNNVPEAVGGILGLSDVVVVSGESISMLSESAVSGKKTIVFPVDGMDRKPLNNKYTRFAEMLSNDGHVACVRTTQVAEAVDRLLRDKVKMIPIDDHTALLSAVRKILQ